MLLSGDCRKDVFNVRDMSEVDTSEPGHVGIQHRKQDRGLVLCLKFCGSALCFRQGGSRSFNETLASHVDEGV